jgi:redox-sensitive bicupin YhaK (pirin superfamily)
MSNVETDPAELTCQEHPSVVADPRRPEVEVLTAREVPLGGLRAMTVRRTLPQRKRSLIGAWCFADHYGPGDVSTSRAMTMGPHPHTGLQTVSWLFSGEIEHRDSLGTHSLIRPGELNLMTSGHGICHAEVSTPNNTTLHGVQLWVALPDEHRDTARDFQHYATPPVDLGGVSARVFLGTLGPSRSPVRTFTPLLGAEITLDPRTHLALDVDPAFEHGILLDTGLVTVAGTDLEPAELGYVGVGVSTLELANPSDSPSRILLLGGTPFTEEIVMWWNFVGRSHEEIVAFREAWQNESDQFGRIDDYEGSPRRVPAPELPKTRIVPRRNPSS